MTGIVFRSFEGSSYLWSLMQIADEKGVPHRLELLELNSPEHLKLHPFGKMPVMHHGEVVLYESLAIAHYIDKTFGGPALQPDEVLGQAHVLRWISIVNSYIFAVMNRFFKERIVKPSWGFEPDQPFIDQAHDLLLLQLRLIDEAVGQDGFLVGGRLTIADCFLFPNLLFFSLTPEGTVLLKQHEAAARWLEGMQARPSYRGSIMERSFAETAKLAEGLYHTPPSTRITAPVV